jgi:hypothetical protein
MSVRPALLNRLVQVTSCRIVDACDGCSGVSREFDVERRDEGGRPEAITPLCGELAAAAPGLPLSCKLALIPSGGYQESDV